MKRFICTILILAILLLQLPMDVLGDSSTDIIVKKADTNKDKIGRNTEFTLKLTLERFSETIEDDSVFVKINQSSSFSLVDIGSTKKVQGFDKITDPNKINNEGKVSFKLKYNGGEETQLPITITYKDGNETKTKEDYVSIPQAIPYVPEVEKPEPPIIEKEPEPLGDPNIIIIGDRTTVAKQGERASVSFEIKNTSDVNAYNITASLDLSDSSDGIFLDGYGHDEINRLSKGRSKSMSFRINVDEYAEDKTYPVKVNLHYNNDDDKNYSTSETIYIRVKGDGNDNQVIIDNVILDTPDISDVELNIKPGSIVNVAVSIKNLSIIPARDLQVSLEGLERDKFSLDSGVNKKSLNLFAGKRTEFIQFPVKVSQKLKAGNHELTAKVKYKNLRNQVLEDEFVFFIPVKGSSLQNSSLIIENVKFPRSIKAEQNANLNFSLRNRGQDIARDIIITAELPDTEGLVPRSVTTIKVDYLKPGESKDISFSFYSTKDSPTKNYPVNIKVRHVDDFSEGDELYELDQFFGIFVDNPEKDDKKSVPKLIIDKYSFSSNTSIETGSKNMVEAGENFVMHLSFYNTNRYKSVENIKIFLTAEPTVSDNDDSPNAGSSVFTPVNSSNTFFIESIPPKGRVEKSITMYTVPDAKAKTHIITANFEYEDVDAEQYKAEELIGVPVIQQSKLDVGEVQYESEAYVGMEHPISVEFYNTGKVTLYNMMVKLEGDFQSESSSYYVGNFSTGTSEFFEGYIIPTNPGELEGEIVFTYEDSLGDIQELRETFSLNVMEDMKPEFPDDFEDDFIEEGFLGRNKKWVLPVSLIIGGFLGYKFFQKKKSKRDDEDLLIDE